MLNTLNPSRRHSLDYGYDGQNNVTSIAQGGTNVVCYTYDGNNNRMGKTMADGVARVLTYDNVERLTSITDTTPSPTAGMLLQKFQYGYDAMSRRTYVKRDNGVGDVYGYDTADQLSYASPANSKPVATSNAGPNCGARWEVGGLENWFERMMIACSR